MSHIRLRLRDDTKHQEAVAAAKTGCFGMHYHRELQLDGMMLYCLYDEAYVTKELVVVHSVHVKVVEEHNIPDNRQVSASAGQDE